MRFLQPFLRLFVVAFHGIIQGDIVQGVGMIRILLGRELRHFQETLVVIFVLFLLIINGVAVQLFRDELIRRI